MTAPGFSLLRGMAAVVTSARSDFRFRAFVSQQIMHADGDANQVRDEDDDHVGSIKRTS